MTRSIKEIDKEIKRCFEILSALSPDHPDVFRIVTTITDLRHERHEAVRRAVV